MSRTESSSQIEYPTELDPKKAGPVLSHHRRCPREDLHEPEVSAMHADAWWTRKAKTHRQVRCPGCTLFKVWLPKGKAL